MDSDLFCCYLNGLARFRDTLTLYGLHLRSAPNEWIAYGTLFTFANGDVIEDRARGPFATSIDARIGTFQIYTCQISNTFTVHSALGATIRWDSFVFWQTGARWISIFRDTLRIWSAWTWYTRIDNFNILDRRRRSCLFCFCFGCDFRK